MTDILQRFTFLELGISVCFLVAALICLVAYVFEGKCKKCMMAHQLIGSHTRVNLIGFICYTLLLGLSFWSLSAAFLAASLALGLHLALLRLLKQSSVLCWVCISVAGLDFLATVLLLFHQTSELRLAGLVIVSVFFVMGTFIVNWLRVRVQLKSMENSLAYAEFYLSSKKNVSLVIKKELIIFSRVSCSACDFYKEHVLPELEQKLEGREISIRIEMVPDNSSATTPSALVISSCAVSLPVLSFDTDDLLQVVNMVMGPLPINQEELPGVLISEDIYPGRTSI